MSGTTGRHEDAASERYLLPWTRSCWVCGQDNPIGLRAFSFKVGDRVELPFTTRPEHAGWSDVIHGGFIATVLDEVMTWAAILGSNKPVFAADFTVRLLEPLRAGLACTAIARLKENRRRVFDLESWLEDGAGKVWARGTGRYMPVPADQFASFHADFVASAECLNLDHIFGDTLKRAEGAPASSEREVKRPAGR